MTNTINIPLGKKEDKKYMKVNVGSNSFEIAVDKKSLEELAITCERLGAKLNDEELQTMENAKKLVKEGYNVILGKGSFKKVFEESGSIVECAEVLMTVANKIVQHAKE